MLKLLSIDWIIKARSIFAEIICFSPNLPTVCLSSIDLRGRTLFYLTGFLFLNTNKDKVPERELPTPGQGQNLCE